MTLGEATHEAARLRRLAGISGTTGPVVSVYLNTRWADEHQRERVRLFLTSELRKARAPGIDPALASDLDWIEAQGRAVVERQLARRFSFRQDRGHIYHVYALSIYRAIAQGENRNRRSTPRCRSDCNPSPAERCPLIGRSHRAGSSFRRSSRQCAPTGPTRAFGQS